MADLAFSNQHNMMAFLEKNDGNADFHQIFWNTAKSRSVNDVKQIHAKVDGKTMVISESSVRSDLHFNDEDGITCLTNENEFSTNIASAVICLCNNQKFNFSKLIFDGMLRNLDGTSKKFLMYPRLLQLFLKNELELTEPFNDIYVTSAHTLKAFANMRRENKGFSGTITPLSPYMLAPQAVEGEGSGQPTGPQLTPSTAPPSSEGPVNTAPSSKVPLNIAASQP
ncbi:hypothetical protein Tco_1412480 [Tanacetum coccineum]